MRRWERMTSRPSGRTEEKERRRRVRPTWHRLAQARGHHAEDVMVEKVRCGTGQEGAEGKRDRETERDKGASAGQLPLSLIDRRPGDG